MAPLRQERVVVSDTDDPLARLEVALSTVPLQDFPESDDVLDGSHRRRGQVRSPEHLGHVEQVPVGVDEAREQRAALEIDQSGIGATQRQNLAPGSNGCDQAIADRERFRLGLPRVDGNDRPTDKHEVGCLRRGPAPDWRNQAEGKRT